MSMSISSASNSYASLASVAPTGGRNDGDGDDSGAASAASAAASSGAATPPPPAASGRGQVLDVAA